MVREEMAMTQEKSEALDDQIMRGFLRLRPDDQPVSEAQANPLHVGEWELPGIAGGVLRDRAHDFERTGNPLFAVEAFLLAIELGVYPPNSILRWVATGFAAWHEEQGKAPMDKALGLVCGKGQEPIFKRALLDQRDAMLLLDMDRLMLLGAKREEAATMVSSRLYLEDWNSTRWDLEDVSADTLISQHKKHQRPRQDALEQQLMKDREWVASWLRHFDSAYMPEAIKSRL
jgi:hypothetical protein